VAETCYKIFNTARKSVRKKYLKSLSEEVWSFIFLQYKITCLSIPYKNSSLFTTTHHSFSFRKCILLTLPYVFSLQVLHYKHWATGMNYYFVLIVLIELIQFC